MRCVLQKAIAILDSGVGGLTVAKEVMRQLPQEQIIYFGDTDRAPYGPRTSDEVRLFTRQIVDFLMEHQPKMIVVACNTATAVALEDIYEQVDLPVVGVIHPGSRAAIKKSKAGVVGVIGTEGTIKSGAYETALQQISPHIEVVSLACPQLVPLVERGLSNCDETKATVAEALRPLLDVPLDCLILGCTHYPFLSPIIGDIMGSNVELINSAEETAREISTVLYHHNALAEVEAEPEHVFYCSGDAALFQSIAEQWLSKRIEVKAMKL